jgi:hypothetical protein
MAKMIAKLARGVVKPLRRAAEEVETRILVAEGRRSVRRKARVTAAVAKRAAKTGLVLGVLAAATVVAREVKKRRRS